MRPSSATCEVGLKRAALEERRAGQGQAVAVDAAAREADDDVAGRDVVARR